MARKRGLGRGLDALLGDLNKKVEAPQSIKPTDEKNTIDSDIQIEGDLKNLAIDAIHPGKYQPRKTFSDESLKELAESIKAQGVIQPILVRTVANNKYEIIAGERRFRAAVLADLTSIPALVRELPDEAAIAMALIENIQREDLNPLEEATGMQRLIDEFEMTHQQVANALGKSRTAVTNLLRLLSLEAEVRQMLMGGELEMGHARALLSLSGSKQISAAKTVASKRLSVRDTEQLVKRIQNLSQHAHPINLQNISPYNDVELQLAQTLTAKVAIQESASGRGKLVIKYKNAKHLQEILDKINHEQL